MAHSYDPQMTTPKVSVVIATCGRRTRLRETLAPLLADPAADEIVVVADGADDGSPELLEDLAGAHPRLRPVSIPRRGRAAARQLGLETATNDIVLLLDDDVVAAPGLVEGHARAHAERDGQVVVGYMPIRLPAYRRPGDASTFLYARDYEGCCVACERDPSQVLTRLWGGNVSMSRSDALRVGMDPAFTYHEDRDFGLRCMKAGLRGRFDRSLRAEHVHARTVAALRRQARGQGAGRVEIHRVHADVLPPFDERRFVDGLPAPLRPIVIASRRRRMATFCGSILAAAAEFAGRLRLWGVETGLVKLLRRVELQRGAIEALEGS